MTAAEVAEAEATGTPILPAPGRTTGRAIATDADGVALAVTTADGVGSTGAGMGAAVVAGGSIDASGGAAG